MFPLLFSWLLSAVVLAQEQPTILQPLPQQQGQQIALIWLQGNSIPAEAYVPPLSQVQAATDFQLWVGIPSFPNDSPNLSIVGKEIDATLSAMEDMGMSTDIVFYGGHSEGGAFIQVKGGRERFAGQGGYICK